MPYALAIHTTTPELGLAISLVEDKSLVEWQSRQRHQTWSLDRALSSHLHQCLAEFLYPQTWRDLVFLAVAVGPGGYTGTRIGVVTARTLAQQLDCPLFAVSSMAAVVWSRCSHQFPDPESDWAIQMPAQRGELYTAIYSVSNSDTEGHGLIAQLPDTVMDPTQWHSILETWPRPLHLIEADGSLGSSVTSVLELAQLAWQQGFRPTWDTVLPYYGQLYVAEPRP